MNVQCVICKDVVDVLKAGHEGFKASALSCGHVFHTDCIQKWFEQSGSNRQGTCPHCRCVVIKSKALRLFFDLIPIDNYQDDPTVIKANNDVLKKDVEDLHDRLAANKQNFDKLTKVNSGLRERVLELEQKLVNAEQNNDALKMTRIKLNKKSKELENTIDELEKLRQNVTSLRASNTILNGSLKDDEVRDALVALEKGDMALLFFTYKKDSEKLLKKVGTMSSELSKSQEETRKLRKELAEARDENSVLNRILEVYHKPKMKSSKSNSVSPCNSAGFDPSPVRLLPGPSSATPDVITPTKRSLVPCSIHPYKIPKMSSVGPTASSTQLPSSRLSSVGPLASSTLLPSSRLGSSSQPAVGPRAPAELLTIPESYDGLGGHSRPDGFPKMKKAFKIVSDRRPNSTLKHPRRERCLARIQNSVKSEVTPDRHLGCRWCLNSWSLGQYTVRLLPQKRPRGFRGLRSMSTNPEQASRKRGHKYIGHNFLSLKCDVCRGITKIPTPKPVEASKEEPQPPAPPIKNKKKKSKKRDDFAGLNPAAVKSAKVSKPLREPCDSGKQVLSVFEVLSPSSIQNGVNIFSNRTSKNRSLPSVSAQDKSSIIKPVSDSPSFKLSSLSKSKKKKVKNGLVEKQNKTKNVKSALASFLNSL